MNEDKIEIKLDFLVDNYDHKTLRCTTSINNEEVKHYCNFYEYLYTSKDNRPYYIKQFYSECKEFEYSEFTPFTCDCGIAGCASIWDGIYTKYRKRSVEWRIPRKRGYERFLGKTFYSFDRKQYQTEIDNILEFLKENKGVIIFDDQNEGYWDEDTDDWVEEENVTTVGEYYKHLFKEFNLHN